MLAGGRNATGGFKVVLKGTHAAKPSDLNGITVVDQDNALVPIDLVPILPGCPKDKPGMQHSPRWSQARASAAGLTLKQCDSRTYRKTALIRKILGSSHPEFVPSMHVTLVYLSG
ncbi:hypothetical protein ACH79_39210 [Bradyrhizobium sp. CCBAU 051011]|nr:hypothetical protein ACH79_39210 [Bradyrhizobium sp. CCBAU 051011]